VWIPIPNIMGMASDQSAFGGFSKKDSNRDSDLEFNAISLKFTGN